MIDPHDRSRLTDDYQTKSAITAFNKTITKNLSMAHLKRAPDAVVAPPLLGVDLGEVADKAVGGHLVEKLLDETEDVQAGPERAGPDASHEKEKLADHYRVLDRDEREHW